MALTAPENIEEYFAMPLNELELHNQRLDKRLQAIRTEKKTVSTAMDRAIHLANAQARWAEMPEAERIAMKQIAQGG